jgi:histone-lysine N-methyltransferase SETMAR
MVGLLLYFFFPAILHSFETLHTLLHDNAPAHRALATQKKLAYLGFKYLDHPPYSPDLAQSDYHLFPGLKKQWKGHHFSSNKEVIAAAETWLDGKLSDSFFFVCVACKS